MSLNVSLYQEISSAASLALVGTRVYPLGNLPKAVTFPLITFQRIDAEHVRHLTSGAALVADTYSIVIWDDSTSIAETLNDALRQLLDNFTGDMGTTSTTAVDAAFLEDEEHIAEFPTDASPIGRYAVEHTYTIWHEETN